MQTIHSSIVARYIYYCGAIGILAVLLVLRDNVCGSVAVWNISQYLIVIIIIAAIWGYNGVVLGGTMAMMIVDIWLLMESLFGFHTSMSMLLSVSATFKLILLFPMGGTIAFILISIHKSQCDMIEKADYDR